MGCGFIFHKLADRSPCHPPLCTGFQPCSLPLKMPAVDQGICGFPTRLSLEAFPRGSSTRLPHVPPWCELILGLKFEAVQGKQVSLDSKYEQSQYELAVTVSTPLQSSLFFAVSGLLSHTDITTLHFCLLELAYRCCQNCKKRRRECRKSARVQTQLPSQESALGIY